MARDLPGSIVKVTINGTSYDAIADTNLDVTPPRIKNEGIATSGRNMRKQTRQVQEVKSVVIACNADERAALITVAENTTDVTLAYTTAAGDVWRASGWIDFEKWETLEHKATLTLFPRDKWEAFVNP
jgi:hypothetical protein